GDLRAKANHAARSIARSQSYDFFWLAQSAAVAVPMPSYRPISAAVGNRNPFGPQKTAATTKAAHMAAIAIPNTFSLCCIAIPSCILSAPDYGTVGAAPM